MKLVYTLDSNDSIRSWPTIEAAKQHAERNNARVLVDVDTSPMKLVYICHPFSGNPQRNAELCREICETIVRHNSSILPIAPQIYLPQFIDEHTNRAFAMSCCVELLRACSEIWVYGGRITDGMRIELEYAATQGITVVHQSPLGAL